MKSFLSKVNVMIVTIEEWVERQSAFATIALSATLLALIGFVDRIAPTEVAFLLFYLIPIFLITWRFNNPWGYVAGIISAVVWGTTEYTGTGASKWVEGWNLLVEVGLFLSFAGLVGSLHVHLVIQKNLNHRLEDVIAEVKRLSGLLPICAWCKRIRDENGQWHQMEEYIRSHADVSITHGICPECREKNRR